MAEGRIYTKEQVLEILNKKKTDLSKQFGFKDVNGNWNQGFYANLIDGVIEKYENGGVIEVERESYYSKGMDYETSYYSDGTTKKAIYSAD